VASDSQAKDPGRGVTLKYWDPEDESFWSGPGRRIASRNLWISIPNLLCGFAVWLYWSIIIVQMQNLHVLGFFPFAEDKSLLYTLPAIACCWWRRPWGSAWPFRTRTPRG